MKRKTTKVIPPVLFIILKVLIIEVTMSSGSDSFANRFDGNPPGKQYNRMNSSGSSGSDKMSDMSNFINRLASFGTWPDEVLTSATELTDNGFYYTGYKDEVICFECDVRISDWADDDMAHQRHVDASPDCPFLALQSMQHKHGASNYNFSGTFKQYEERVNMKISSDKNNSVSEIKKSTVHNKEITTSLNSSEHPVTVKSNTDTLNFMTINNTTDKESIGYTQREQPSQSTSDIDYTVEANRHLSFIGHWFEDAPLNSEDMVQAGLYYTGPGDRVQCAWCRGGMYNWEEGDTAIGEHQRHFPECMFVQNEIQNINYPTTPNPIESTNGDGQETSSSDKIHDLPVVKIAQDMGYEMGAITKALDKIKKNNGSKLPDIISSEQLLDAIFELENECEVSGDDGKCEAVTGSSLKGATGGHETQVQHTTESESQSKSSLFENEKKHENLNETEVNKLIEENNSLKGQTICKICLENEVDSLFLPCRHLVCCTVCSDAVQQCPLCRTVIIGTIKTSLS